VETRGDDRRERPPILFLSFSLSLLLSCVVRSLVSHRELVFLPYGWVDCSCARSFVSMLRIWLSGGISLNCLTLKLSDHRAGVRGAIDIDFAATWEQVIILGASDVNQNVYSAPRIAEQLLGVLHANQLTLFPLESTPAIAQIT